MIVRINIPKDDYVKYEKLWTDFFKKAERDFVACRVPLLLFLKTKFDEHTTYNNIETTIINEEEYNCLDTGIPDDHNSKIFWDLLERWSELIFTPVIMPSVSISSPSHIEDAFDDHKGVYTDLCRMIYKDPAVIHYLFIFH